MKHPPKTARMKFAIMITATIITLAIIITLICLFTIKPSTTQIDVTPTSEANIEEVSSTNTDVSSSSYINTQSTHTEELPSDHTEYAIPESAEVDDSFFANTLFIGNSITEGFQNFSGLNTATFYQGRGMTVENIYKMKVVGEDGSSYTEGNGSKTTMEALKERQFNQIYIMLGANELGWVYPDLFIKQYAQLIDDIRALQPNAKICVQSILPVSANRSATDNVFTNEKIENLNQMIIKMAMEKEIPYLNAAEAFKDENGALPEDQTPDGIHLEASACKTWRMYIKTHTMQ